MQQKSQKALLKVLIDKKKLLQSGKSNIDWQQILVVEIIATNVCIHIVPMR